MDPDQVFIDERFHEDEEAKPFIKRFADYSEDQLDGIITKYVNYEPAAVRAALYLSVQKGLISYELKEQLGVQIESNLKKHLNHIRSYEWEKNNSFVKYVSACTDDQIYDIIEKPGDIATDVYFAVLTVAMERELISGEDFNMYCLAAKSDSPAEHRLSFDNVIHASSFDSEDMSGEQKPDAEPKRKGLIGPGFSLIVIGIFVAFFQYNRTYHGSFAHHTRFLDVGFGIFIAAAGLVLLSFGIWMHFNKGSD